MKKMQYKAELEKIRDKVVLAILCALFIGALFGMGGANSEVKATLLIFAFVTTLLFGVFYFWHYKIFRFAIYSPLVLGAYALILFFAYAQIENYVENYENKLLAEALTLQTGCPIVSIKTELRRTYSRLYYPVAEASSMGYFSRGQRQIMVLAKGTIYSIRRWDDNKYYYYVRGDSLDLDYAKDIICFKSEEEAIAMGYEKFLSNTDAISRW